MDLFSSTESHPKKKDFSTPLAARLAPRDWTEFFGQEHLVNSQSLLRRAIDEDHLPSCIFYGPSGTGKTALARLAAKKSQAAIEFINAVTAGVGDLRQVIQRAIDRKKLNSQKTLLIIDEIHHFNRTQQDALLPDVERGTLTFIGLTTENPFFYVNNALLSRSTAFELKPLNREDLIQIVNTALQDPDRGWGIKQVKLNPEALNHFIRVAEGDARRLLNALELAIVTHDPKNGGDISIDLKMAEAATQKRAVRYDKKGDEHYDTISAFIKSMRGSDPDAALYWMARMIEAGEDPRFIARRMMVFASEDIGNADPQAIILANAVSNVLEKIGMPEARITLAQGVTYLSTAPKSNASYLAIDKALNEVRKGLSRNIPNHLRDGNMDKEERGHGKGYKYPHDFPGHHVEQVYLPDKIKFYEATEEGFEKEIKKRIEQWEKKTPKN
jgi:putative ATPase